MEVDPLHSMTSDCPAAFHSSLETLTEPQASGQVELPKETLKDLIPLGHEISLWANAAKNLAARVSKDRLPADLNAYLKHWLPKRVIEPPTKTFHLILSQSDKSSQIIGSSLPWMNDPSWNALLQLPALRSTWINDLRSSHFDHLLRLLPAGWLMHPTPLPPGTVIPGLEIPGWPDLARYQKANRRFKIHSEQTILNLDNHQTNQEWLTNITQGIQSNGSILVEQTDQNSWLLARYEIHLQRISLSQAWHAKNDSIYLVYDSTKTL